MGKRLGGAGNFFSGTRSKIPPGFSPLVLVAAARRRHPWRVRHWDIRVPISPLRGLRRLRNTPPKIFPSPHTPFITHVK